MKWIPTGRRYFCRLLSKRDECIESSVLGVSDYRPQKAIPGKNFEIHEDLDNRSDWGLYEVISASNWCRENGCVSEGDRIFVYKGHSLQSILLPEGRFFLIWDGLVDFLVLG